MSTTIINPAVANMITPTVREGTLTFKYSTDALSAYSGVALAPGENTITQIGGLTSVPILTFGRNGSIASWNCNITMDVNGSNADDWELHLLPFFIGDWGGSTEQLVHKTGATTYTLAITRTHPASTVQTDTLLMVRFGNNATVIGGGGSESTVSEPTRIPLVASHMLFDIRNKSGSTDTFTIASLAIWGSYTETY